MFYTSVVVDKAAWTPLEDYLTTLHIPGLSIPVLTQLRYTCHNGIDTGNSFTVTNLLTKYAHIASFEKGAWKDCQQTAI